MTDRRSVIGILAAVGIGLLAAVLVMTTLRAGQETNSTAIRALEQRAQAAEVMAARAQADADRARQDAAELRALVLLLQEQVRSLGGVPVTSPGTTSEPARPAPSTSPAGRRPTATPSPRAEPSPPAPTPQPSSTRTAAPSPSPSPSRSPFCLGPICLGG